MLVPLLAVGRTMRSQGVSAAALPKTGRSGGGITVKPLLESPA